MCKYVTEDTIYELCLLAMKHREKKLINSLHINSLNSILDFKLELPPIVTIILDFCA